MDKSLIKIIMDFQTWLMKHIGQFYLWAAVTTIISTTIYYYSSYINHISTMPYWIIILFLYYVSFKVIIR